MTNNNSDDMHGIAVAMHELLSQALPDVEMTYHVTTDPPGALVVCECKGASVFYPAKKAAVVVMLWTDPTADPVTDQAAESWNVTIPVAVWAVVSPAVLGSYFHARDTGATVTEAAAFVRTLIA